MTSVLHVLDASCDPTTLQVLEVLRGRQAADAGVPVCAVEGEAIGAARRFLDCEVRRTPGRLMAGVVVAGRPGGWAWRHPDTIIHAWGIAAARFAATRARGDRLVLTLLDPAATGEAARWVRSFPGEATVIAGSQVIRARLVSAGMSPQRVVVVRGPVDFAAINEAKAGRKPADVGSGPVLLLSGPASRGGGQYYGLWATAIVRQIHRGLRVVLPYASAERERLLRFVRQIGMADMVSVPDESARWAELVAAADLFVVPAVEEVGTEPIGWAMAAGVAVVGSAVRSVAELIADKSNGFLCKPREPRQLAARLLTAWEDAELRRRVVEVARGQAYEVFGVRNFVDQMTRVYENVARGSSPGEGVRDWAMAE